VPLGQIYACIPLVSACAPDCGLCCGIVPFSESEVVAAEKASGKKPTIKGTDCCFLTAEKSCEIYDVRPLICRLFGAVDELHLRCPRGVCGAEFPLTREQAGDLVRKQQELGEIIAFPTISELENYVEKMASEMEVPE